MANESRKYAEDLVGNLDRTFYNTQRTVSNKKYDTNWKNLQRQYQNLTEDLKLKQEQIDRSFADSLATIAENDYLRGRAAANDLALRGLTVSGEQELNKQDNVAKKGEDVLNIMESAGGGSVEIAKALEDARNTLVDKEADLNKGLADTLANIGDAEGEALRAYNEGLANIAGAKDARDMENELARLQLEAQRQAQAYSKSGVDDAEEEQAKRKLMMDILKNSDWSDAEKASAIQIFFGKDVNNAKDIVSGYNMFINQDDAVEAKIKELTKERGTLIDSIPNKEKYKAAEENVGNSYPFFGLSFGGKKENDRVKENIKSYNDALNPRINEIDEEINKLKNREDVIVELAKIMYGDDIINDTELGKKYSSDYKYGTKK